MKFLITKDDSTPELLNVVRFRKVVEAENEEDAEKKAVDSFEEGVAGWDIEFAGNGFFVNVERL
jgi:hypothetical protein